MEIMNEATILFIMELIGTVAFTISGALIAIRCSGNHKAFGGKISLEVAENYFEELAL